MKQNKNPCNKNTCNKKISNQEKKDRKELERLKNCGKTLVKTILNY